jgi:hypothetical protein
MSAVVQRPMRTLTVGVLLALLGVFGFATAASAKGKRKDKPTVALVKEFKADIPPDTTATVDAECPNGYDVLGGSYSIGGSSFFAHASEAAPLPYKNMYRVQVTNPFVNPFAGIPPADANVTVGAICAVTGKPVVVDGEFGKPRHHKPGKADATIEASIDTQKGIANNSVTAVGAKCPKGHFIYSGGYATGGSPWAHTTASVIGSRTNAFSADLTHPPFDPALGILNQHAAMRVAALCTRRGEPLVLNATKTARGDRRASAAAHKKPKSKPTVVLVKDDISGVQSGEVESVEAKCPHGYSVFGGSVTVSDSALAMTTEAAVLSKLNAYRGTVANPPTDINGGIPKTSAGMLVGAMCAKDGKPIVVDGPFPNR